MRVFHENPNSIHTELYLLTLKEHNHKICVFLSSIKIFEAIYTNSVHNGSTMFASMLMLNRHF